MANIRLYPGMWVKIMETMIAEDGEKLDPGEVLQILNTRWFITFVGKKGVFPYKSLRLEKL